jgi:uncharacterized membrane protein YfcA
MELNWIFVVACGALAGFLNGWLGFGSLAILIPAFIWQHTLHGFLGPEMILASLTSAFSVSLICSAALWARYSFARMGPSLGSARGLWLGAAAGTAAGFSVNIAFGSVSFIDRFFGLYLLLVVAWLVLSHGTRKSGTTWSGLALRQKAKLGFLGGIVSGLAGFCGHSFFVPALHREGFCIKESIAAAQQVGFFVAATGLLVFGLQGAFSNFGLPELVEVVVMALLCLLFGELGARLKLAMSHVALSSFLTGAYALTGVFLVLGIAHNVNAGLAIPNAASSATGSHQAPEVNKDVIGLLQNKLVGSIFDKPNPQSLTAQVLSRAPKSSSQMATAQK